jgi:hypothetical protein
LGRLSYKMPEDFLLKVSALADKTDVIIPKVLEEGGHSLGQYLGSAISFITICIFSDFGVI